MKIYIRIFLLFSLLSLGACKDWLDLQPEGQATSDELFATGDGYRSVLAGIYLSLIHILSMNGYMYSSAGYENVELLEECDLLKISNRVLNQLFEENTELANWGRRMSDIAVMRLEKLFMERYFMSAAARYHLLVEREPEILQKVPLRHIASFLGISQVSLSRIRAGVQ